MQKYPIVILPGWLLGSDRFKPLAKLFQNRGYETFTVDFPGFSLKFPMTAVYTLTDYVKFVQKYLKQQRIQKAIFICHSFGGRVALKLLSQEPQKAACLIISGTPGFPSRSKFARLMIHLVGIIGKILVHIPPFIFFRGKIRKIFYRLTGSMDYYYTDGLLKETFIRITSEPLIKYMEKIRLPTLLLWGSQDKLVPVSIAKHMQQNIKNSELIIVKDHGHNFVYKEAEEYVKHAVNYLNKLKG